MSYINWPDVKNEKKTDEVFRFFDETKEALEKAYNGELKSQLARITIVSKELDKLAETFTMTASHFESGKKEYASVEKNDDRKNKKVAIIKNEDYRYDIFNDHLYYEIFRIRIPEYYPVTIEASKEALENGIKEINNIDELCNAFNEIVTSNKVRMIIKKMLER